MARQVTLAFDQSALENLTLQLDNLRLQLNLVDERGRQLTAGHIGHEINHAITYLSTWAMDAPRYQHCVIYLNDIQCEFTACYWETIEREGRPAFVLGAVWHDDDQRFGFHS